MTWAWWMTLAVILAVLLLIGCIPVGVDAAYGEGGIRLAVKIWLFRLQLLPQKLKKKKKPAKRLLQSKKSQRRKNRQGRKSPTRCSPAAWTAFWSCWISASRRSAICAASSVWRS